jgi:hypothetical protein
LNQFFFIIIFARTILTSITPKGLIGITLGWNWQTTFGGDAGDDGEGENDDEEELIQDGSPQLPKEKSLIPALCVMPKSIPFHPQLRALEVGKQFDFASGSFGY